MYGPQDIDVCIHECRASTDDDIYVATLEPQRDLRLLDLTHLLEEDVTEFESLNMATVTYFSDADQSCCLPHNTRYACFKIRNEGSLKWQSNSTSSVKV